MAPEDGIDQILVTEHLDDLQLTRAIAMEALDSVITKMQTALEKSANCYEDLRAKYLELKDAAANNAAHVTPKVEGAQGYVVAIIDAHSHNFMDPFLQGASDNGAAAAKRVEEIVTEILRRDHPDLVELRVLIRVYADVQLLFSQLKRVEDQNIDSLRSFVQEFSSASPLTDFIDGSHRGLPDKILGVSQWHMQDPNCKHILFNIAEDSSLHNMLVADPGEKRRTTDIPGALARILPAYVTKKTVETSTQSSESSASDGNNGPESRTLSQERMTYGYFENNRYIPVVSPDAGLRPSSLGSRARENASQPLSAQPDRVSINYIGHRIDAPLPKPTQEEIRSFQLRTKRKKLCTQMHVVGRCTLKQCLYDHSPVTPGMLLVLRHKLRDVPCRMHGNCRIKGCFHGHLCVVQGCKGRGDKGCKFDTEEHDVDVNIHKRVLPTSRRAGLSRERITSGSIPEAGSHKGSMETWPTMVADLIEI